MENEYRIRLDLKSYVRKALAPLKYMRDAPEPKKRSAKSEIIIKEKIK